MKFRTKEIEQADVNITPLIDIVFILLIFFMVSTTFKQEFEVGLELPEARSDSTIQDKSIEITINSNGEFFVNRKQLVNTQVVTIKRALEKIAGDARDFPIIISADSTATHQSVITAMDAARQLGFSKLNFSTQQTSDQ